MYKKEVVLTTVEITSMLGYSLEAQLYTLAGWVHSMSTDNELLPDWKVI